MPEAADALAARAATGDAAARDALVERLLPLLGRLARRFEGRAAREDLEQAGVVGLLSAVPGYDPGRGTGFSTYATPFVVGEMLAVLRGSAAVHVSRTGRDLATSVEAAADAVAAAQGRPPSLDEIATAADLDEEDVVTGLAARRALAPPVPGDVVEDAAAGTDDAIAALEDRLHVGDLLRALDRRSQAILVMRFGLEMSQAEIGERLGISQMHVSRLLRTALEDLDRLMG
jgi:RNA polymerase sigma-B factor